VVDGPLFKKRIEILESGKGQRKGYYFLDISKYKLGMRCLE
jgi:diphthamide synthase (EF-2-diphthine--ammonia ligase)